jgi:hypothetical protein
MKLFICSLLLLFAFSLSAQAPVAVPIANEPHHHLVFENEYVRVFRVSIPAHDATLLHQHDVPYIYVSLGPADVINAVQGRPEARIVMTDGQLGYSLGHFAHIARTDAGSTFDNVTIELLHPQGELHNLCAQIIQGVSSRGCDKTSGLAAGGRGFSVEPQWESEEINLDLLRLGPQTNSPKLRLQSNSLLVVLNESEVQVDINGKSMKPLKSGEVIWIDAGSLGFVSNPSNKRVECLHLSFQNNGKNTKSKSL